jgi:hypothetical protein
MEYVMSVYIDKKYINLASSMLPKFKWKKENLANCRCFICGDSTKSKSKARGYFFVKNNNFFYKCHNCGVGYSVYNFLQQVAPSLCKEYSMERFCAGEDRGNYKKPTKQEVYPFISEKPTGYSFTYLSNLPEDHKAIAYVKGRKIPKDKWEDIGYTTDINVLAGEFDETYKDKFSSEDRLVVVIRSSDAVCGFQCRSFNTKTKQGLKYITLKKSNELCYYGLNSLDTTKKFYILEGPINSMFIPNSIATLGSSNFLSVDEKINDENGVYVIDNEPYKVETLNILSKLIENGKNVCIFPENIKSKDINDMILSGYDPNKIIDENTYSGLKAQLVFNKWKKVNI